MNPLPHTLFNCPYKKLVGLHIDNLINYAVELYQEEVRMVIDRVKEAQKSKEEFFFEYTTNNIDGSNYHTLCYAEQQSSKGDMLCHFLRMTHDKRVSGCGKCVDYVLGMAMRSMDTGVCIRHIEADKGYIYMNQAACDFYGCTDKDHCVSQNKELQDQIQKQALTTGERVSFDTASYDEQGKPKAWYHIASIKQSAGVQGDYFVTTIADISEQKKHQAALEETRLYLGLAIGAGEISVWRYNIKENAFYAIYDDLFIKGGDTQEHLMTLIHPDDLANFKDIYHRLVTKESPAETIVHRVLDPNSGQYHYVKCSLTIAVDHSGQAQDIIGTYKDITESRVKELELENMRNSLDMAIVSGNIQAWEYDIVNRQFRTLYSGNLINDNELCELSSQNALSYSIHPSHKERYLQFVRELVVSGGSNSTIVRGLDNPNGTRTYYDIVVSTVKNTQGDIIKLLGTRRDVSVSQLQKIELEKMQKYLSLAMEAGEVSVWIYDVAKEEFFTLLGDTLAGKGLKMADNLTMMHPDDAIICQNIIASMANGEKSRVDVFYRYKSNDTPGGYRYYEARKVAVVDNGKVTFITGTQKDITNEYLTRLELEQSNQRAKTAIEGFRKINKYNKLIMNNANCGLVYITPDFVVRWENINSAGLMNKFFNPFRKGDVCYKVFKGLDAPCEDCIITRAINAEQNINEEKTLRTGAIMDFTAIPVYDINDNLEGTVLRLDNVTDKKKSIIELKKAKEKAERSDQFKSNFLANMSHEIRTPLNAIVGFSELIVDADDPEEKREYSKIIAMNNELLLKLINDILDLSKMEAGYINIKNAEFDMADWCNELYTVFAPRMHPGVQLICDSPYKSCVASLDKNRLTQVATNFITNAIKFTPKGSITIGYERIDIGIRIYVTDTGIGIDKDKVDNVFDRFEKLNDFIQGNGLGLSISKSIVEASHGTIGVDSILGQGSTFWAKIPCTVISSNTDCVQLPAVESAIQIPVTNERKRVLVAEDNESNYVLLESLLKKQYDVTRATNGKQAVESVANGLYDVVLMDLKMPVMDGLTAIRTIRQDNQTIPIIALSANVFDSDRKNVSDAGGTDFLTKPINKAKLFEALARACYNAK
ncbi:MAG: response regulator [Mucinivorans sp.]